MVLLDLPTPPSPACIGEMPGSMHAEHPFGFRLSVSSTMVEGLKGINEPDQMASRYAGIVRVLDGLIGGW